MAKPDLTRFYACFQASLAAQQPKPKRKLRPRPPANTVPARLLLEDYSDAVCLLHKITPAHPSYMEVLVDIEEFDVLVQSDWSLAMVGTRGRICVVRCRDH